MSAAALDGAHAAFARGDYAAALDAWSALLAPSDTPQPSATRAASRT